MDNKKSKKIKESVEAPVPAPAPVAAPVAPVEKKPRKPRGPSKFMQYVSEYQKTHKGLTRAQAMKEASVEYKKNKPSK